MNGCLISTFQNTHVNDTGHIRCSMKHRVEVIMVSAAVESALIEIVSGCVTSAARRRAPDITMQKRDIVQSEAGGVGLG